MVQLIKKLAILFFSGVFLRRPKRWRVFINLEIGAWFIRRGAGYQVGQPFVIPVKKKGRSTRKKVYIKNLYYNFRENKITHAFSDTPIPGLTEKFEAFEKGR